MPRNWTLPVQLSVSSHRKGMAATRAPMTTATANRVLLGPPGSGVSSPRADGSISATIVESPTVPPGAFRHPARSSVSGRTFCHGEKCSIDRWIHWLLHYLWGLADVAP